MASLISGKASLSPWKQEHDDLLAAADILEQAEMNQIWKCEACGIKVNIRPGATFTHPCPYTPEISAKDSINE